MPDNPAPLPTAPLAYENSDFLDSPDGRSLRILAEYNEPITPTGPDGLPIDPAALIQSMTGTQPKGKGTPPKNQQGSQGSPGGQGNAS